MNLKVAEQFHQMQRDFKKLQEERDKSYDDRLIDIESKLDMICDIVIKLSESSFQNKTVVVNSNLETNSIKKDKIKSVENDSREETFIPTVDTSGMKYKSKRGKTKNVQRIDLSDSLEKLKNL